MVKHRRYGATALLDMSGFDVGAQIEDVGKLFLARILDLHDRGLAGWSMSNRATAYIVVNALVMALARRHPDGEVIHHADRGGQYVSGDLALTMADHYVAASFGRTGVCWDNAAIESTWATVKKEIRHIHGEWATMTRSQLRTVPFDYIETFYNRRRHQAHLGHRTPNEALHCLRRGGLNHRNPCPPNRGRSTPVHALALLRDEDLQDAIRQHLAKRSQRFKPSRPSCCSSPTRTSSTTISLAGSRPASPKTSRTSPTTPKPPPATRCILSTWPPASRKS